MLSSDLFLRSITFVTTLYIARTLQPRGFGDFVLAQSVVQTSWIAVDMFGNNAYGAREVAVAESHADEILNLILSFRCIGALIVTTAISLAAFLLVRNGPSPWVFVAASMYLVAYSLFPDWYIRAIQECHLLFLGYGAAGLIFAASVFLLVRGNSSAVGPLFLWSLSYLCGAILLLASVARRGIRLRPRLAVREWLPCLQGSVFFTLGGVAGAAVTQLPVLILWLKAGSYQTGIFGGGFRLFGAILMISTQMPWAFYPVMAKDFSKGRDATRASRALQRVMITVGMLIAVAGVPAAGSVIRLLLGSSYERSINSFVILVCSVPIFFWVASLEMGLLAAREERSRFYAFIGGLPALLAGWFWLIPKWGAAGAALCVLGNVLGAGVSLAIASIVRCGRRSLDSLVPLVAVGGIASALAAHFAGALIGQAGGVAVGVFAFTCFVLVAGVVRVAHVKEVALALISNERVPSPLPNQGPATG